MRAMSATSLAGLFCFAADNWTLQDRDARKAAPGCCFLARIQWATLILRPSTVHPPPRVLQCNDWRREEAVLSHFPLAFEYPARQSDRRSQIALVYRLFANR